MGVIGSASLIGREQDLDRLEAFVTGARDGPAKLLLEGEAGIGKTTLWRAGVERARELGFRVLESRTVAPERDLSFAGLGDLLSGTHDEIGGLPAPQRRALRIALVLEEAEGEPADQRAVAAAMLGLLRRLTADRPLVIALDDIQWLDAPSAGALQFAFRRLEKEPVRVLATSRVRTGLTIIGFDDAERISLGPVSLQALDRLVRTRLGARFLRPTLRRLEEASGGNPFYALEIAASFLRSGVRVEPGEPLPIPAVLREVVRDRLATLGPAAREAALTASALARPTMDTVQQAIGGGLTAVTDAIAAGILDSDGETLCFTHPLFASTLYEDTPLRARRDVHKRLAAIVGDAEERAHHLAEAADGPDEEVAAALEAAAASVAARGAPDAAARLAKQALDLTPPDQAEAHRRCLAWARFSAAAGDPQHAEALLEGQLELAEPGRERAEVEFELGKARLATRGISTARACYERALREVEESGAPELQALIQVELADMYVSEERPDSDVSARAVALAEKTRNPDLLARALGIHGLTLVREGQPPPDEYWWRALEIEEAAGELRFGGPAHTYSYVAFMRDDLQTSIEHADRVADSMRRRGDPLLPTVLLQMSDGARVAGDGDAAERLVSEAHDLVVQTGRQSLEPQCVLFKGRLALLRGDLDLARQQTEEARQLLEQLPLSEAERTGLDTAGVEALAFSVFGRIEEVSGRYAEAHTWFTAAIEILERLELREWLAQTLDSDISCLVMMGALEDASRQLDALLELSDLLQDRVTNAFAARAQGLVAAAESDFAAALARLNSAVEYFEAGSWPGELARTLLALGGTQRRARQKRAARQTLERALEIFERLGARLWVEKTRAELRQISGRSTRSGVLTATEQSVAGLVADGRSNIEVARELFISPKTVEWNLSKIYKKLHVRSRAELAAKFAKRAATQ
jgi:DNA-binding CsgD family transcriptional regulator